MTYHSTTPSGISSNVGPFLQRRSIECYPHLVPGYNNDYSYQPHLVPGIVFCVAFGLALIGHFVQFARLRRWTSVLFAIGAFSKYNYLFTYKDVSLDFLQKNNTFLFTAESIGWAGRTWSAKCPYNHDAFLIQITTLIIAPTFFAAGLYVTLGWLIRLLGPQTSLISPKIYLLIFCTCDIISLILQAVGGGLASVASGKVDGSTKPGTLLMVGGIAFQLGTMTFFLLLVLDFLRRTRKSALSINYKKVLLALSISFTMIYIRSIYRTIELAQGWAGYLITHEGYFLGLDASIMAIAVCVFLVFDPATLLPKEAVATRTSSEVDKIASV